MSDPEREPRLVTPELLRDWPLPDPAGSKKARGQAVIIGGARNTPGAVASPDSRPCAWEQATCSWPSRRAPPPPWPWPSPRRA